MTTFKNNMVGASVALIALVSLALPLSFVQAEGTDFFYPDYVDYSSDYSYSVDDSFYPDYIDYSSDYSYGNDALYPDYIDYSTGYGNDALYPDYIDYSTGYASGGYNSGYSYGGSSFSMPSFANQAYRTGGGYPTFPTYPSYTPPSKPGNTTVTTNTCVNDSCNYVDNSIVDNSVKISNSFNNQPKKQQYNDCYDYNDCYVPPPMYPPIAYNPTPYITLSQTPYTGLDLGPMGEVLYWTFLVLWCLGAAYLIVVKRVQNKLVGFLNGFLFGSAAPKASAHAVHTPVAHTTVAAQATLVEEGIDPFIQSQIKRS